MAQGFDPPHYRTVRGNRAEIDLIIRKGLELLPIEVKATENISGQSFKVYQEKYSPALRIRFSMKNLKMNGNLLGIPIFLCDWLKVMLSN